MVTTGCLRRLAACIVLCGLTAIDSRGAHGDADEHWCPLGFDWNTRTAIPVWIHPEMADYMWHPDFTAWTDLELRREVQFILEKMMDQAPSGMPPMYFAGFEYDGTGWDDPAGNGPGGTPGEWNIAIRPKLGGSNPCQSEMEHDEPSVSYGKRVRMAPSFAFGCAQYYAHWRYPHDGTNKTFGGVLMHEIMHALGYHHEDECDDSLPACTDNDGEPNCCGLMSACFQSPDFYEMEYQDYDALTAHYGYFENDAELRRESADGLIWITMGANAIASGPNWASGAAFGNAPYLPVLATRVDSLYPDMYRWNVDTQAFTSFGVPYSGTQLGNVATAVGGGYYYAFFMRVQTITNVVKRPRYAYWNLSGSLQSVVQPTNSASRNGITGAFDAKTGKLVMVWRDADNKISVGTMLPGQSPTTVTVMSETFRAAFTPSVVCGPVSLTHNCLMVWASSAANAGDHFHVMTWAPFNVTATGGLDMPAAYSNGLIMYGPPAVTYRGPSTSATAFVVGYNGSAHCFYTFTKSGSSTASFTNSRTHCSSSSTRNAGPPLMGGTGTSQLVEAWSKYNVED